LAWVWALESGSMSGLVLVVPAVLEAPMVLLVLLVLRVLRALRALLVLWPRRDPSVPAVLLARSDSRKWPSSSWGSSLPRPGGPGRGCR
jgi:hypothetical protein